MKDAIHAEMLAEVYESNPELKVLESIKEIVAPTLDEEYLGNVYTSELRDLREKVEELEEERELEEGAKKLAELLSSYEDRTKNIITSLIRPAGPEDIVEQFSELMETLEDVENDDDDDDSDDLNDDTDDDDDDDFDFDDDDDDSDDDDDFDFDDDDDDDDNDNDDDDDNDNDDDSDDDVVAEDTDDNGDDNLNEGLSYRDRLKNLALMS